MLPETAIQIPDDLGELETPDAETLHAELVTLKNRNAIMRRWLETVIEFLADSLNENSMHELLAETQEEINRW
jgi:hypothetical protein